MTQRRDTYPRYFLVGNLRADLPSGERTKKQAVGCCMCRIDGELYSRTYVEPCT